MLPTVVAIFISATIESCPIETAVRANRQTARRLKAVIATTKNVEPVKRQPEGVSFRWNAELNSVTP